MKKNLKLMGRYLILLLALAVAMFILVSWLPSLSVRVLPVLDAPYYSRQANWFQLDQPLFERFLTFYEREFTGNWGTAWFVESGQQVLVLFQQRLSASLAVLGLSCLLMLVTAIPLGIYFALHEQSLALPGLFTVFRSVPVYWLGMLLFLIAFGLQGALGAPDLHQSPGYILLPVLIVFVFISWRWFLVTSESISKVLKREEIKKQRLQARSEKAFFFHTLLSPAVQEFLPAFIYEFPIAVFGATIFSETIFSWPGLGSLFISALRQQDWPVIQALILPPAAAFYLRIPVSDLLKGIYRRKDEAAKNQLVSQKALNPEKSIS